MNDYKQIDFAPLYYINISGNSVLKKCNPNYYIIIDNKMYHRSQKYGKPNKELDENLFCIKNNMIFRKIKIYKNNVGYNAVKIAGKHSYIHRLVYAAFVGVIPSDKEINHIDHNKDNNSLDNLELLSHSENQIKAAEFYGKSTKPRCKSCGKKITPDSKTGYCRKCKKENGFVDKYKYIPKMHLRKVDRPKKEELAKMIISMSFLEISRQYGVSDNAIRKWCKTYNLPFRKKDIKLCKEELEKIYNNNDNN